MIKLLTILSSFLVSHLIALDPVMAHNFVVQVAHAMLQPNGALRHLPVPRCDDESNPEKLAFTIGCTLLKELAFKVVTYLSIDVMPVESQKIAALMLEEYSSILHGLV